MITFEQVGTDKYEVLDKTLLGFIYKEEKAGQFLFTNITQIRVFDSSI